MPTRLNKLTLNSASRSSGTANRATFENIKWQSLIPCEAKKIRIRAQFYSPPTSNMDVAPASLKGLMVVNVRIPTTTYSQNQDGGSDMRLMTISRSLSDTVANANTWTTYVYDTTMYLAQLDAVPNGSLTVSLSMHSDAGVQIPFLSTTNAGANMGDASPWCLTLFFDSEY